MILKKKYNFKIGDRFCIINNKSTIFSIVSVKMDHNYIIITGERKLKSGEPVEWVDFYFCSDTAYQFKFL